MADSSPADSDLAGSIQIAGEEGLVVPWAEIPGRWADTISRQRIGFECSSGDWIERTWVGIPIFEALDEAKLPPETTHVRMESVDGIAVCIPVSDLDGAVIALADGDNEGTACGSDIGITEDYPRFVSSSVVGPRAVKQLSVIEPLSLAAGEDRNEYESLPKRD